MMVQKKHHFFLFFDKIFDVLTRTIQQILEAPQQNAQAAQQILQPVKFQKQPVFQKIKAVFCHKNCKEIGVMV